MSEFSVDYSSDYRSVIRRQRQRQPSTPASSCSFTAPLSRGYAPSPATPFATDDDTSWQSEVSWQFEPSGWHVGHSLGAALSPWPTSTSAAPASRPRRTFRSANDYYLSHTYGGKWHRSFLNPSFEFSTVGPPPRRIELQSFVGGENQSSSALRGFSRRRARNSSLTTSRDELSTYVESDCIVEHKVHVKDDADGRQYSNHRHHSSRDLLLLTDDIRSHEASKLHIGQGSPNVRWEVDDEHEDEDENGKGVNHHAHDGDGVFADGDDGMYDDEEEEEEIGGRAVGLFGLFRYSTKLDMALLLLGCVGALINGGSLPWYSFLFGNFVNKIAEDNKDQIMEDVRQVLVILFFFWGCPCLQ